MRSIYIILLNALLLLAFTGCDKFLEQEPLKQTAIDNVDQLQALLDNATAFYQESNYTAAYSTDDTEIKPEEYAQNTAKFGMEAVYFYTFNIDQIESAAADALWGSTSGEFRKIFLANTVLDNIEEASGSEVAKAQVKADAHFVRAYSYWVLANYYCMPYTEANLSSPGLPLKRTSNVEESLVRATLDETYQFILSDLNEAMKVSSEDVDPLKPWHVTKKTVEAMFSRYYLFTGDYAKALDYANKALASSTVMLKDYKTITAGNPLVYNNPAATVEVPQMYTWSASQSLYWPEIYYPRFTYVPTQWFVPSTSLRNMYEGENDLRYKWFMIENGGRRFSVITPEMFRYSQFFDGRHLISGLSRAEMLLTKAEALARTDKPGDAMSAVNELRATRFTSPTDLTAANKDEAIANVLAERRREFPFATRWVDIRRFSVNEYAGDDVTVTHEFFKVDPGTVDINTPQTYTLPVGSRRYMVPINGVDIDASKGQLEQNVYE